MCATTADRCTELTLIYIKGLFVTKTRFYIYDRHPTVLPKHVLSMNKSQVASERKPFKSQWTLWDMEVIENLHLYSIKHSAAVRRTSEVNTMFSLWNDQRPLKVVLYKTKNLNICIKFMHTLYHLCYTKTKNCLLGKCFKVENCDAQVTNKNTQVLFCLTRLALIKDTVCRKLVVMLHDAHHTTDWFIFVQILESLIWVRSWKSWIYSHFRWVFDPEKIWIIL